MKREKSKFHQALRFRVETEKFSKYHKKISSEYFPMIESHENITPIKE